MAQNSYYAETLAGQRLKMCYDLAPPSVQRYLAAEISHVRQRLRPEDRVLELFSSYAAELWEERLQWFRIQAAHGLVGEIDEAASRAGVIVCKDGFTATTLNSEDFRTLASGLGRSVEVCTVDNSSVFCEITVEK